MQASVSIASQTEFPISDINDRIKYVTLQTEKRENKIFINRFWNVLLKFNFLWENFLVVVELFKPESRMISCDVVMNHVS